MKQLIGFVAGILIPGLIMAGGTSNFALAQAWPTKPIHIVIAQAPGSATDVISRVVGNQLSVSQAQPVVIDAGSDHREVERGTVKVVRRADVKATLGAQGLEAAPRSPEQFAAHIK